MKTHHGISDYIKNERATTQKPLKKLRALLRKAAPKAIEKLAWGMPTFYLEGNLFHFAAFKNHMSFFAGTDAVEHFNKELGDLVTSKATIHLSYEKELPAALITKIAKYCVRRNLAITEAKAKKKKSKKRKVSSSTHFQRRK
jgi:uncharacterized protein YdhG (YjbR/CyaY superfamily)